MSNQELQRLAQELAEQLKRLFDILPEGDFEAENADVKLRVTKARKPDILKGS